MQPRSMRRRRSSNGSLRSSNGMGYDVFSSQRAPARLLRGCLGIALIGAAVELAVAVPLSYEDARASLLAVSDRRKADEAVVNRRDHESRAADSLGLPSLFLNATEVWGIKTGTIPDTPIGNINFKENFAGPRASVNTTWSIYSGGRISAAQRALAGGGDEARPLLIRAQDQLDVELALPDDGVISQMQVERTRN